MRIVTWNANCRFRDKIQLFCPATEDVLVIQECENTIESEKSYRNAGWRYIWSGSNQHKGLGIFVPSSVEICKLDWNVRQCRYFLPARINGMTIVGVWAMGGKSKSTSYAGQISQFLDIHKDEMKSETPLLIGDFNSNSNWDARHKRSNHTVNNDRLREYGLESLFHTQNCVAHGEEQEHTFYMYRHKEKPYHIDFAYLPLRLLKKSSLKIGKPAEWLQYSDHMPLFIKTMY